MPIRLNFQESRQELYTYHFVSGNKTIVDADWVRLFETFDPQGMQDSEYLMGAEHKEETAVYLGLAWGLSEGLERFVIPNYYRDEAAKLTGLPFEFVNWEYDVDTDTGPRPPIDRGFVPARAVTHLWPPPSEQQVGHQHEAGLFHVQELAQLINSHTATVGDASSEVTLFCLKPGRRGNLVEFLRSPSRPELAHFLADGELFIDIVLGIDMGFNDSLLIKSTTDIAAQVHELSQRFEQAVAGYERSAPNLRTLKQALRLLHDLAHGQQPHTP
jgi:hypothetical protein